MTDKISRMESYYDELFKETKPFREVWEGRVGIQYKVPKEVGYLIEFVKGHPDISSVLEVGAGDGLAAERFLSQVKVETYVATEMSQSGVDQLLKKGVNHASQMDATNLTFADNSFDMVCCFNVMHHVDDPAKMASEMLRVSKKYVLLCESNGLSLPRKILELTPRNRRANENSYLPSTYRGFFEASAKIKWLATKPFSFIFTFTPDALYEPAVQFSELMEKIPVLKSQCSSILLVGEKV